MPRKPSNGNGADSAGHNGYDPTEAEKFAKEILTLKEEKAAAMARFRNSINEVYANAKAKMNLPKQLLKEIVTLHEEDERRRERIAGLPDHVRESLEQLREGLGTFIETPLGEHILKQAEAAATD